MAVATGRIARALNLRPGEERTLAVLGAYLLLCTAAGTILVATMNGLFLSVYPGRLIPHVIIASALLTAVVAILFSGVIAGTARRALAAGLTATLLFILVACRWAVAVNPRWSFAVYLAVSTVQVLLMTHAWDFVGDLLKGRQARRLVPLLGIGASLGAILGGAIVAPAAVWLGSANLLLVGGALIGVCLPLIWLVPKPSPQEDEASSRQMGAVRAFTMRAGRGFRSLSQEPLLRLLAIAMLTIGLTGTLIELEFKLALQASYDGDRITAILGVLSSITGTGTLLLQLLASRWIFPKLGVSVAASLHGGVEALAVGVASLFPGVWILAGAFATDDILQNSVQKGWEHISLVPFSGPVKSAAIATLDGVIQPLARAAGGVVTILLVSRLPLVSAIMTASAVLSFVVFLRHRKLYVAALTRALTRHTADFTATSQTPLVADHASLAIIDKALEDRDATVVVFALSLLEQLTPQDAVPRAIHLLSHDTPEVRAEAAQVIGRLEAEGEAGLQEAVVNRLGQEEDPSVLASLLTAVGGWVSVDPGTVEPFLEHPDGDVRREALVALGRTGWPPIRERLRQLLVEERGAARGVAAGAVGALGLVDLVSDVADAVDDDEARPAALQALIRLGAPAVPALIRLLERRDVPLPVRRTAVTALASMGAGEARRALLGLVEEPALGPAALTSLQRLRRDGHLEPVSPETLRSLLHTEIQRGLRYALVASLIRVRPGGTMAFISGELQGLCGRAVYRVGRILSLTHDPTGVEAARAGLGSDDVAQRGNALDLLESMLSPEEASLVLPFVEAAAERFPAERLDTQLEDAESIVRAPLESLLADPDWWPRALALHGLGRDDEISIPGRDPGVTEDPNMIPLIERVMILKGSQLFRHFPGSDLAGIASLAEVVHLETDDAVFHQGDPGDAFYMVVQGSIRIMRGSHELALLGSREGFGEMAILDPETRSATATAAEPTTLLRIDRDSFDRLIEQNPSVARGIYRMLTQRLRNTLAQVAAG